MQIEDDRNGGGYRGTRLLLPVTIRFVKVLCKENGQIQDKPSVRIECEERQDFLSQVGSRPNPIPQGTLSIRITTTLFSTYLKPDFLHSSQSKNNFPFSLNTGRIKHVINVQEPQDKQRERITGERSELFETGTSMDCKVSRGG